MMNDVNSTQIFDSINTINNNDQKSGNNKNPLWMDLMDQSQLVMTAVGLIGNIATSITLIKNGQVSKFFFNYCKML